jgi:hypothetical protein
MYVNFRLTPVKLVKMSKRIRTDEWIRFKKMYHKGRCLDDIFCKAPVDCDGNGYPVRRCRNYAINESGYCYDHQGHMLMNMIEKNLTPS